MRIFIVMVVGAFFSMLLANDFIGNIEALKGRVKVKSENSIRKSKLKIDSKIQTGDLITTSRGSYTKIKLVDGSLVLLDESSSIIFDSVYSAKQDSGRVYYKITSRNAKNSIKIKTPFAIIGVKGTTFIINSKKDNFSVALKEGLIGVASIKEEFELYRKKVKKQFEDFMAQQQAAYEEYKKVQQPGFVEKTKEFDLHEKKTISFDGNKANEKDWTQKDDEEFEYFQELMSSMK